MVKLIFVIIVGIVAVSFASILIKACSGVPSIVIATYRLDIASFIILTVSIKTKQKIIPKNKNEILIAALGGLFLAMHFFLWISSLKYTSIPSSVVLVTTNPIFVAIFSYLIFKEKQKLSIVISILLSILGSAVIASADGNIFSTHIDKIAIFGDILALCGAMAASGYLMVGSRLRKNMGILQYITLVYTFSAIFISIIALVLHPSFIGYSTKYYVYMIILAILPQLIGHTSFNWALRYLKTTAIAVTILGEPIGASILAYLFFSETIGIIQFGGITLIFIAIILSTKYGK